MRLNFTFIYKVGRLIMEGELLGWRASSSSPFLFVVFYSFELGGRHVFCIIIHVLLYVLNPLLGNIE